MVWAKNKEPLRPEVWSVLAEKSKAVAWITDKCENLQTDYLAELQTYLVEVSRYLKAKREERLVYCETV